MSAFSFPGLHPVTYGPGCIQQLPAELAALSRAVTSVLIVSDPGLAATGAVARVAALLGRAGLTVVSFAEVESDPTAATVDRAAALLRQLAQPAVVGLGGGSALDVAKLAAAVAAAEQPAQAYALCALPLPKPLPTLLLPTTAGTGSEATRTAVFSADGRKLWAWGEELRPARVLLDPELTVSLPAALTAATGLDALVHAIEACTARRAQPLASVFGLHAIGQVARYLPHALAQPADLTARGELQLAAFCAGVAIDTCGTGIAHALGHALGALGHVHHGRAVALSLAAAIDANAAAAPSAYAAVAAALGAPAEAEAAAPAYRQLLTAVGLDVSLAGVGLTPAMLLAATFAPENAPMRDNNPWQPTPPEWQSLVERVLA